jgi:hypothetical protein
LYFISFWIINYRNRNANKRKDFCRTVHHCMTFLLHVFLSCKLMF